MIYLDNAATSFPKPECVHQEMQRFLREDAANPGRAGHKMAVAAARMLGDVRRELVEFIGGKEISRLIFTLNCTDALNMAMKGLLEEGDHAITTHLEHNSVSRPLQAMADAGKIKLTRVVADSDGVIDPDEIARAITPKTKLVVMTHVANALGTIQPVEEVGQIVREAGKLLLVDSAQSIGIIPIDVEAMKIDMLAFPGHKGLLGPTGTGGLYIGQRVGAIRVWREGGTGGDSSSPTQPVEFPFCLEGGTANTVGLAGLGAGVRFVRGQGDAKLLRHERALVGRFIDGIVDDERFNIVGARDPAGHIGAVSITIDGTHVQEAAAILDESFEIAVRSGLHCAPYTHKMMGTSPDGTLRVSPGYANTEQDIDAVLTALQQIVE